MVGLFARWVTAAVCGGFAAGLAFGPVAGSDADGLLVAACVVVAAGRDGGEAIALSVTPGAGRTSVAATVIDSTRACACIVGAAGWKRRTPAIATAAAATSFAQQSRAARRAR